MNQAQLAELLGIAQSQVSKYESGDITPSIEKAAEIAAVLGMSELELLYPERFGFVRKGQDNGRPMGVAATEARAA